MLTDTAKEFANLIGQFYLDKNGGDYAAAEKEIMALRITHIEETQPQLIITTDRPGLLIGKRGENIDKLQGFLKSHKIVIKENPDPLWQYLVPYRPELEAVLIDDCYDYDYANDDRNHTDNKHYNAIPL